MRPVLVTGGAGRLARAIGRAAPGRAKLESRKGLDIRDPAAVRKRLAELRPAALINCAVVNGVDAIEQAPERAYPVNALAPGALARCCAETGTPFIHISTDYVFGAAAGGPWPEDAPHAPVNAYGRMKAEGEARVLDAFPGACVVRVAWLFGDEGCFIAQMLERARREGEAAVVTDQVGSPTPVDELAARLVALADLMAASDPRVPPVLHLAGGPPVSRFDWVRTAFEAYRGAGGQTLRLRPVALEATGAAAPRPAFSALDVTLAEALFGWRLPWAERTAALGRSAALRI